MIRPAFAAALLATVTLVSLTGCESDEDKLQRLRGEAAVASLSLLRYQALVDSAWVRAAAITREHPNAEGRARGDSIVRLYQDSVRIARNRHELAERELRRFLR